MTRQETLCRPCAEWLKTQGWKLTPRGRSEKIDCAICYCRRYGKLYDEVEEVETE